MDSPSTQPPAPRRGPRARRRRGFTLVELLVVIVIIGILVALLLPAINGAVKSAKTTAAAAEVNQLAQALAQFKSEHGVYPPSRLVLIEAGNYSAGYITSNAVTNKLAALGVELAPRSVRYLRRIWPKMLLSTTGPIAATQVPGGWYDFNGDNNGPTVSGGALGAGQIHYLDGAECLVFFLGGLPGTVDGGLVTTGFAKNPANPAIGSANLPLGANRSSPMFEFRPGRLVDVYPRTTGGVVSGNGFPEYWDNLSGSLTTNPQPYVYFSSYEGAGYDPDDANYAEEGTATDGTPVPAQWFSEGVVLSGVGSMFYNYSGATNFASAPYNAGSFAPNPYTNGAPVPVAGNTTKPEYINKDTFQIVSAGLDGLFGPGGGFKSGVADPLAAIPAALVPNTLSPGARLVEKDNVTNFKGGRLD